MAELSSNWKMLQAKLELERKSGLHGTGSSTRRTSSKSRSNNRSSNPPKRQNSIPTGEKSSRNDEDPTVDRLQADEPWRSGGPSLLVSQHDRVNCGRSEDISVGKYIAVDCEMVGVGIGGHESALARVSLVDFHGRQLYDSYVKQRERVTDWRTAVSGISWKEMKLARSFEEVQREVSDLLKDRVLIGHDIKHDMEALKLSHPAQAIRDTAKYPPFRRLGNGRKPALKILARELLGLEIQNGRHSSTEDARTTMFLFRKYKSGFDVDHANRWGPKRELSLTPDAKPKSKKKRGRR